MNFEPHLTSIRKRVKGRENRHWEWTNGGCFAFVSSFVKVFGGKEFGICEYEEPPAGGTIGDYPVHHAIIKYKGKFYDAKGEVDMEYWKKQVPKMVVKSKEDPDIAWFDDYFLNDKDYAQLEAILKALVPDFKKSVKAN